MEFGNKKAVLKTTFFCLFTTLIYYSHVQIYNRTCNGEKSYKGNKCVKTFSQYIYLWIYKKGQILEKNFMQKQCVKAFAYNSSHRKRLWKSHEEKVIIQLNPINIDNVLMFCPFWCFYTTVNFLLCNQSTKAFLYLNSLWRHSRIPKVRYDYKEFGKIWTNTLTLFYSRLFSL